MKKKKLSRNFAFGKNLWSYHFEKSTNNLYFFKGFQGIKRKKLKSLREKQIKNLKIPNNRGIIKLLKKNNLQSEKKIVLYSTPKNKTQSLFYNNNLKEKIKLRSYYGNFNDNQLKNLYNKAESINGYIENNIINLLERRLDSVLFRMNFAKTIFSSRQLISHNKILVNKRKINIPSYLIKNGDLIEIKKTAYNRVSKTILDKFYNFKNISLNNKILSLYPCYIEINYITLSGIFLHSPSLQNVSYHNNNINYENLRRLYL